MEGGCKTTLILFLDRYCSTKRLMSWCSIIIVHPIYRLPKMRVFTTDNLLQTARNASLHGPANIMLFRMYMWTTLSSLWRTIRLPVCSSFYSGCQTSLKCLICLHTATWNMTLSPEVSLIMPQVCQNVLPTHKQNLKLLSSTTHMHSILHHC